ncbi:MAG: hypothetical protein ACI861_001945 [Paracoccaceae bacterium]|jgi:hypothetical protein
MSQANAQVLSASDLLEGDVIYLDPRRQWTRRLTDALIFSDPDLADEALKHAAKQINKVLGAYLVDVVADGDTPIRADHFREVFRSKGPSNRHHGKQAN